MFEDKVPPAVIAVAIVILALIIMVFILVKTEYLENDEKQAPPTVVEDLHNRSWYCRRPNAYAVLYKFDFQPDRAVVQVRTGPEAVQQFKLNTTYKLLNPDTVLIDGSALTTRDIAQFPWTITRLGDKYVIQNQAGRCKLIRA